MEFRAMNGLVSKTARTDEFLRGLDFLLQFVRCQIEVWNIRACGALQEAGQRLAQKLSRLPAGDAPLPVKFQNNEFARSRVGWRWKKFCDSFGDLKSHIVSNMLFYTAFAVQRRQETIKHLCRNHICRHVQTGHPPFGGATSGPHWLRFDSQPPA